MNKALERTHLVYLEMPSLLGYLFLGMPERCLALNCRASSYVSLVRPVLSALPIPGEYSFLNEKDTSCKIHCHLL